MAAGATDGQSARRDDAMPELCRFFGIVIQMYYADHGPPHIHALYQGEKAALDFDGNILRGGLRSRTAMRLVREWIDLHVEELEDDWALARTGQPTNAIAPLD